MDEVKSKRETVVITKHGEPVAKLVPVNTGMDDIFGLLQRQRFIAATLFPQRFPPKSGAISSDPAGHARCDLAGSRARQDLKES